MALLHFTHPGSVHGGAGRQCRAANPVQNSKSPLRVLMLGAIGVVYGDIGTSVL